MENIPLVLANSFRYLENMEWDDLRFFLAVARTGSLSGAAEVLRVSPSTVSRRLAQLEHALKASLFAHHQTGYILTDDGTDLLAHAEQVETSVNSLEMNIAGRDRQPEGLVKLATAENLANHVIIPALGEFRKAFPKITLEISTGIGAVSLSRREADLAVRLQRPTQGNVNIRKLGIQSFGLYGSEAYVRTRAAFENPARFDEDQFITWGEEYSHLPMAAWLERRLADKAPALITHSLYAQAIAAQNGIGLAVLPCFIGDTISGLQRLAFEGDMIEQEIWLVTHRNLAASARVKSVSEFLVKLFTQKRDLLTGNSIDK